MVEKRILEVCSGKKGKGAGQTKAVDGPSSRSLICVRPPPPTNTADQVLAKPGMTDALEGRSRHQTACKCYGRGG